MCVRDTPPPPPNARMGERRQLESRAAAHHQGAVYPPVRPLHDLFSRLSVDKEKQHDMTCAPERQTFSSTRTRGGILFRASSRALACRRQRALAGGGGPPPRPFEVHCEAPMPPRATIYFQRVRTCLPPPDGVLLPSTPPPPPNTSPTLRRCCQWTGAELP